MEDSPARPIKSLSGSAGPTSPSSSLFNPRKLVSLAPPKTYTFHFILLHPP